MVLSKLNQYLIFGNIDLKKKEQDDTITISMLIWVRSAVLIQIT